MDIKLLKEMEKQRDKNSKLIKLAVEIKREHSKDAKDYLDRFIKFPGALSVVSIFFVSSELVKNLCMAFWGTIFIIISLLIALDIFRRGVNNDRDFIKKIDDSTQPMVNFSKALTGYSRKLIFEDELQESYRKLNESYEKNSNSLEDGDEDIKKNADNMYKQINISFYVLIIGITLCIISVLPVS